MSFLNIKLNKYVYISWLYFSVVYHEHKSYYQLLINYDTNIVLLFWSSLYGAILD